MKIVLRSAETFDGKRFVLCSDNGKPLPGQLDVTIIQQLGKPPIVVASFVVDGEDISIE